MFNRLPATPALNAPSPFHSIRTHRLRGVHGLRVRRPIALAAIGLTDHVEAADAVVVPGNTVNPDGSLVGPGVNWALLVIGYSQGALAALATGTEMSAAHPEARGAAAVASGMCRTGYTLTEREIDA